ncbi:cell surface glycoprotein related protein [Halodesulfurarchaeum formicicum]|uniref:Cell surface glycoprotein related protein n=2 Tax=Halodesulfurarchaeum formicicum TaxID=1873524 RepID=A0A1J1AEG1_9EURY|nr:cell surface glycoprotein related protein [Halodesulfurarchaeum formicicum]
MSGDFIIRNNTLSGTNPKNDHPIFTFGVDSVGDVVIENNDLSGYDDSTDSTGDVSIDTNNGEIGSINSYTNLEDAALSVLEDNTGVDRINLATVGITATGPGDTVQNAVDTTTEDGTILVTPGTYKESVTIDTANVTLESTAGADATTINATESGDAVSISSQGVTVSGFTLETDSTGVDVGADADAGTGIVVTQNNIDDVSNGINATDGSGTVDAAYNWWGDRTGPSGEADGDGASISANVDYVPFYLDSDGNQSANAVYTSGSPVIQEAEITDTNNNGNIDNVTITVDEAIDDEKLDKTDFSIDGQNPSEIKTGTAFDETIVLEYEGDNELTGTGTGVLDTFSATISDLNKSESEFSAGDLSRKITDSAEPVVTDVSAEPSVINSGNAPTSPTITVTFSESVSSANGGTFQVTPDLTRQSDDGKVSIDGSIDNDTLSGTTVADLGGDVGVDYFGAVEVTDAVEDDAGNSNIDFNSADDGPERLLDVDRVPPELSDSTVTTLDTDEDGTVDQLKVDFNDDLNDNSVQTDDFEVTDPNATITSWETGEVDNDNIIFLDIEGLPSEDTAVAPELTVKQNSLEDTAGNTGPTVEETQRAVDGASPIVTDISLNESVINNSDVPTDVEVNVTFSEALETDSTVTLAGLGQGEIGTNEVESATDANLSVVTASEVTDNDEDTEVFVDVSDGIDSADNAQVAFNQTSFDDETLLIVDTEEPSVTVSDDAPVGEIVNGTLDLSTYFDVSGAESDSGSVTYSINTTGAQDGTFTEVSESFDSESVEDTDSLVIKAVGTDDVGNSVSATTGSISVDNTAPDVTVSNPAETTAAPTDGTLEIGFTVDELNVAGDATVELTDDEGNIAEYQVGIDNTGGETANTATLRLNVSEDATADENEVLPTQVDENFSFDTQTLYDLSVTVEDEPGQSTTATFEDALFLDDTSPEGFSLLSPTEPKEYEDNDGLPISYGYTENNTDEVTVSLTNESGAVANMTVDESLYVDDGVVKSFEAQLFDSFNTGSLADGRYNVSVTVTDLAGNEYVDSTDNGPVAINNNDESGSVNFEEVTATADLNDTSEEVTVDVTYNVSVTEVEDPGALDPSAEDLNGVTIDSADDLVTYDITYYDDSAETYVNNEVGNITGGSFDNIQVVDNETITATKTVGVNLSDDLTEDADRVLDYTVNVDDTKDVSVKATSTSDVATQSDTVDSATATLTSQEPIVPSIEHVEVDDVDTPSNSLTITFDRPVTANVDISTDDFAYENVSGQTNYVTSVSDVDGDRDVSVTLEDNVLEDAVGTDILSIQPDVFKSVQSEDKVVPAVNSTFDETDAPAFDSANYDVGENASTIDVGFDQEVVDENGDALTAGNFTYSGDASVVSVDHTAETKTATVHLDGEVTSDEIDDSEQIKATGVSDRFDNVQQDTDELTAGITDDTQPDAIEVVEPSNRDIKQSDDTLQVAYKYTENIPDGVEDVTVKLVSDDDTYEFDIDDSQYANDGTLKTVTLDLGDKGGLKDNQYAVEVSVTDAAENQYSSNPTEELVVINDEAPGISNVEVSPQDDIAPGDSANVEFDLSDATDVTNVDIILVQEDTEERVKTDLTYTPTEDGDTYTESITVPETIADNEAYTVVVTATDESGFQNYALSEFGALDVNAEAPYIESVETDAGTSTATVTFSEPVEAADGTISADDFAYQDVSASGASAIESATQTGPATVELELDQDVSADGLEADLVSVRKGAIHDTAEIDVVTALEDVSNEWVPLGGYNYEEVQEFEPGLGPVDNFDFMAGTESQVEVTFTAPVEAADGEVSADDFSYWDLSEGGASGIVAAEQTSPNTILLTLNDDLAYEDVRSGMDSTGDAIKVNSGALQFQEPIEEPDYAGPRDAASDETDALQDTTPPSASIIEDPINADNVKDYDLTVDTGDEKVSEVTVTLTGPNETEVNSTASVEGPHDFNFDASELEDGNVSVAVDLVDAGENEASESTTVTKDTVRPEVTAASTNAGTDEIVVAFDESVNDANSSESYELSNLTFEDSEWLDDKRVRLTVQDPIEPDDIGNENVTVTATEDVENDVGSSVEGAAVTLSDEESPNAYGIWTSNGTTSFEVRFSENVYNESEEDLTVDDFTYVNVSGEDHEVVDVTYDAGDGSAMVTIDSPLVGADLNEDKVEVSLYDSEENHNTDTVTVKEQIVDLSSYEVTSDDGSVEVSFTTSEELESFEIDYFTDGDLVEFDGDDEITELDQSDFEVSETDGAFTYTFVDEEVPRDGSYVAALKSVETVGGQSYDATENDGYYVEDRATVDQEDPNPVDAEVVNAGSGATAIAVQFNEPVDIVSDNWEIEIDGVDQVATVHSDYSTTDPTKTGEVFFEISDNVATGDAPSLSFSGDGLTEFYGVNDATPVSAGASTTLNTHEYHLSEGVNFVSVPAATGSLSLSDLSDEELANVESIMTYDRSVEGNWATWTPNEDHDDDFEELKGGVGYIVKVDGETTWDVNVYNTPDGGDSAASATPQQTELQEGWNLVGHWQEGNQNAEIALGSVHGSVNSAYGQQTDGEWSYTLVTPEDRFQPGEAYWVFVTDDEVYGETPFGDR